MPNSNTQTGHSPWERFSQATFQLTRSTDIRKLVSFLDPWPSQDLSPSGNLKNLAPPPPAAKLKRRELIIVSLLGAILVEKFATSSTKKFLLGALVGFSANVLSWQGSIPKKSLIISSVSAGVGATSFNGMMKWLGSSPKTASGAGVFLGSVLPPLLIA